MNRKESLVSVSLSGKKSLGATPASEQAVPETMNLLPIVDTHQHLVDVNRFGENWAKPPVPGQYGIEEYKEVTKGLNVVKAVYMEVAVPEDKRRKEALYALEMCRYLKSPTAGAVIKADLYAENFRDYMLQFKDSPFIKGIRPSFRSKESLTERSIIDRVRFLGETNMRVDFIVPPSWFPEMSKLMRACPDTWFQADHCGNADPRAFFKPGHSFGEPNHTLAEWRSGMEKMASEKNVVCKISGLVSRSTGYPITAETMGPAIDQCFEIFGPDRVMFASDWPWCLRGMSLAGWVNVLKEVVKNRPLDEQKKMFHDNAVRHYDI